MLLSAVEVFSQDTLRKTDFAFSPELIGQGQIFGGANLTIGRVVIEKVVVGMVGTRIGVETNFKSNSDFIIAPKIGYEVSPTFFVLRLSGLCYFQNGNNEFRLLPEVGFSYGGLINLTYGYNIRLTASRIDDLRGHRWCLSFNLNKKLIEELL